MTYRCYNSVMATLKNSNPNRLKTIRKPAFSRQVITNWSDPESVKAYYERQAAKAA